MNFDIIEGLGLDEIEAQYNDMIDGNDTISGCNYCYSGTCSFYASGYCYCTNGWTNNGYRGINYFDSSNTPCCCY